VVAQIRCKTPMIWRRSGPQRLATPSDSHCLRVSMGGIAEGGSGRRPRFHRPRKPLDSRPPSLKSLPWESEKCEFTRGPQTFEDAPTAGVQKPSPTVDGRGDMTPSSCRNGYRTVNGHRPPGAGRHQRHGRERSSDRNSDKARSKFGGVGETATTKRGWGFHS
jgi:hypothetical protein